LGSSSDAPPIPWLKNPATFVFQEEESQWCQGWPHPIYHLLAAALRYFAGGSPYDIAGIFCISVTEVHQSVWRVVNAVKKTTKRTLRCILNILKTGLQYVTFQEEKARLNQGDSVTKSSLSK
jgi:hypothetical protein